MFCGSFINVLFLTIVSMFVALRERYTDKLKNIPSQQRPHSL